MIILPITSLFLEVGLVNRAKWTHPISRQILELGTRSYPVVRISNRWVINITADFANILFHDCICFN